MNATRPCAGEEAAPISGRAWREHVVCALQDPDSHWPPLAARAYRPFAGARRHVLVDLEAPEVRAEVALIAGFKALKAKGVRTTDGHNAKAYLAAQLLAEGLASGFSRADLGRALRRLVERGTFVRDVIGVHRNRMPKCVLRLAVDEPPACVAPCAGSPL